MCQYAAEVLKTSDPTRLLHEAIMQFTDISSFVFNKHNMKIAVHGSKNKQEMISHKIEVLLTHLKNENSRYLEDFRGKGVDEKFTP